MKRKKLTVAASALTLVLACSMPAFAASGRPVETLTPSTAASQQETGTARTGEPRQGAGASKTGDSQQGVSAAKTGDSQQGVSAAKTGEPRQGAGTAKTGESRQGAGAAKTGDPQQAQMAPTPEQRKTARSYIAEKGKELGDFGDWSLEDKHEYSLWVQAQGIPQDQTVHGLPGEDNMSQEEAVRLARETIMETYCLKEATLDRFHVQVEFNVIDAGNPVWQIYFDVKDSDDFAALGLYRVFIDDAGREVVKLEDASSYAIPVGDLTTLPGAAG